MFTKEEKDFIDSSPGFVNLLRSMTDSEVSAFTEILPSVCNLSQEERKEFCRKVSIELEKMGRPSRIKFA